MFYSYQGKHHQYHILQEKQITMNMFDKYFLDHYDEIQDFICGELADEAYYELCEQALQEELAWYSWARSMGYE